MTPHSPGPIAAKSVKTWTNCMIILLLLLLAPIFIIVFIIVALADACSASQRREQTRALIKAQRDLAIEKGEIKATAQDSGWAWFSPIHVNVSVPPPPFPLSQSHRRNRSENVLTSRHKSGNKQSRTSRNPPHSPLVNPPSMRF
jgi:hypothetical protein